MGRTAAADTTQWETDIGTNIGVAITATGTTGRTVTHLVAPAGGGHPKAVSGCADAATATARPTAIIEDGAIATMDAALGHTAAGGTSAEQELQRGSSTSPAPGAGEDVLFDLRRVGYRP